MQHQHYSIYNQNGEKIQGTFTEEQTYRGHVLHFLGLQGVNGSGVGEGIGEGEGSGEGEGIGVGVGEGRRKGVGVGTGGQYELTQIRHVSGINKL